jgi:hypothetical protein
MGHGIVPDDASWGTFMWVIAAFIITTVFLALSLQTILTKVRHCVKRVEKIIKPKPNPSQTLHTQKAHGGSSSAFEIIRHGLESRRRNRSKQAHLEDVELADIS